MKSFTKKLLSKVVALLEMETVAKQMLMKVLNGKTDWQAITSPQQPSNWHACNKAPKVVKKYHPSQQKPTKQQKETIQPTFPVNKNYQWSLKRLLTGSNFSQFLHQHGQCTNQHAYHNNLYGMQTNMHNSPTNLLQWLSFLQLLLQSEIPGGQTLNPRQLRKNTP